MRILFYIHVHYGCIYHITGQAFHPIKLILGCWLYSMVQTRYKNQQNGSGLWMEFQLKHKMFKLTKIKSHNLYLKSSEAKCSLHTDLPAKTHYIQCTIYIDLKSTLVNNVIKYANIEHCMTCTCIKINTVLKQEIIFPCNTSLKNIYIYIYILVNIYIYIY